MAQAVVPCLPSDMFPEENTLEIMITDSPGGTLDVVVMPPKVIPGTPLWDLGDKDTVLLDAGWLVEGEWSLGEHNTVVARVHPV